LCVCRTFVKKFAVVTWIADLFFLAFDYSFANRTVAQIETARHKIDITTHFQNLCLSQYFYDVFVEVALCYL